MQAGLTNEKLCEGLKRFKLKKLVIMKAIEIKAIEILKLMAKMRVYPKELILEQIVLKNPMVDVIQYLSIVKAKCPISFCRIEVSSIYDFYGLQSLIQF